MKRSSTIDRLPAWADSAKQWAFAALVQGRLTRPDILREFDARLRAAAQAAGVAEAPQVSRPAFDRWAERIAVLRRRLEEVREIARSCDTKVDRKACTSKPDPQGVAAGIHTLVDAMLSGEGEPGPDFTALLTRVSRALKRAEKPVCLSPEVRKQLARVVPYVGNA